MNKKNLEIKVIYVLVLFVFISKETNAQIPTITGIVPNTGVVDSIIPVSGKVVLRAFSGTLKTDIWDGNYTDFSREINVRTNLNTIRDNTLEAYYKVNNGSGYPNYLPEIRKSTPQRINPHNNLKNVEIVDTIVYPCTLDTTLPAFNYASIPALAFTPGYLTAIPAPLNPSWIPHNNSNDVKYITKISTSIITDKGSWIYDASTFGYDIKYSTKPLTGDTWDKVWLAPTPPTPDIPGSQESFTVTRLLPNTTYYFDVKMKDEEDNWSKMSNIAPAPPPPDISESPLLTISKSVTPTVPVSPGGTLTYTLYYKNIGQGTATNVILTDAIPQGTIYITNSAVGVNTNIYYSHDGGLTYDTSQDAPVTHIRWELIFEIGPGSSGNVSFKVRVK